MTFFVPINKEGESQGIWKHDGNVACKIGVVNALEHPNSHFKVDDAQSLLDAMNACKGSWFVEGHPCAYLEM